MLRFTRFTCQPPMPLGKNRSFVTGSKTHWNIAKQGVLEGTVLLKNNGVLPLTPGAKVCLFGSGAGEFQFGGGGSGGVITDKAITLADGLRSAANAGKISFFSPLVDFYLEAAAKEVENAKKIYDDLPYWRRLRNIPTPELPEELYLPEEQMVEHLEKVVMVLQQTVVTEVPEAAAGMAAVALV